MERQRDQLLAELKRILHADGCILPDEVRASTSVLVSLVSMGIDP